MALSPLPHATRSEVFTALFNLLQTMPSPTGQQWGTVSQALQSWDDIPSGNQPALFLHRGIQIASQKAAYGVTKWQWNASAWIYYRVDGLKTPPLYPDQVTDTFLDSMEQVFLMTPYSAPQTLGGLVVNCWINGQIVFDSGFVDGQGVIVCPLSLYI